MTPVLRATLAAESRRQRPHLLRAMAFAALVSAASVALLGLSGWFITAAALAGSAGTAAAMAFNYMLPSAAIRLLAIVRTGGRYGEALAAHRAALGAIAGVRPALFRAVAAMPVQRALDFSVGETTARLVNDLTAIEHDLVRRSAPAAALTALLSGVALLLFGGMAAAIAVALIFVITTEGTRRLALRLDAPAHVALEANGALKRTLGELFEAGPELRCYGLEAWAAARAEAEAAPLADAQIAIAGVQGRISLLHASAIGCAAAAALWLIIPAGAPLAAMAALAAAMTIDGAAPLLRRYAARAAVLGAEKRLAAIGAYQPAPAEPALPAARAIVAFVRGEPFAPGARLAISGRSGSGKTSLIEALLGLRPARPGMAWFDDIDIAYLPAAMLRPAFAWAPQDARLIAGTVRDNLALANPAASETEMWQAIEDAALGECVRALPHGLDSWIGENGEQLSGGERRRLSLARAYLAPAPWLVLDEPTESLDPAVEQRVVDALNARLERTGQGLILASHRVLPHRLCASTVALGEARVARCTAGRT